MTDASTTPHYEIRVTGHLGPTWASYFDGLTVTNEPGGTAVLRGPVVDQAALHGLLHRLSDLGLALESLTPYEPPTSGDPVDDADATRSRSPEPTTNPTGATS